MKRNGITDMLHVNSETEMKNSSSSNSVPNINGKYSILNLDAFCHKNGNILKYFSYRFRKR